MHRIRTIVALMATSFHLAGCAATGNLVVRVNDENGQPVEGATVVVSVLNNLGINAGKNETDYDEYQQLTDATGTASVSFPCLDGEFSWWVKDDFFHTDGKIHDGKLPVVRQEPTPEARAEADAEARRLEAGGIGDWAHVFALAEPFAVSSAVITNTVMVVRKQNPKPMHAYDISCYIPLPPGLPIKNNADEIIGYNYDTIGVDLRLHAILPPYNGKNDEGEVADFWLTRTCMITNGVEYHSGSLAFDDGCGAYKLTLSTNSIAPSPFQADTNATFLTTFDYHYEIVNGKITNSVHAVENDEVMILYSRVKKNEHGVQMQGNFSKIVGGLMIGRKIVFDEVVFNPVRGDISLELDHYRNLDYDCQGKPLAP